MVTMNSSWRDIVLIVPSSFDKLRTTLSLVEGSWPS